MLKPKFCVGDKVKIKRTGQIVQVLARFYQPAKQTPAIKVYENGKTIVADGLLKESWLYRLSGDRSYRFYQDCLESATECRNCATIGWDWVTGCDKCGLCPEDLN